VSGQPTVAGRDCGARSVFVRPDGGAETSSVCVEISGSGPFELCAFSPGPCTAVNVPGPGRPTGSATVQTDCTEIGGTWSTREGE
jgi:hypothetical protein